MQIVSAWSPHLVLVRFFRMLFLHLILALVVAMWSVYVRVWSDSKVDRLGDVLIPVDLELAISFLVL